MPVPDALQVTAGSDKGIAMVVEHPELPVVAVQLHSESILAPEGDAGFTMVADVMRGPGG